MTNDQEEVVPGRGWTQIARIIGLLAVVLSFLCFAVTLYGMLLAGEATSLELIGAFGVLACALALLIGTIVAYSREKVGGIITVAISIALMIWTHVSLSISFPGVLLYGGLPLLAGVLFLVDDTRTRREASRATAEWKSKRQS
ncbi:MAG: hypothetical protein NTX94_06755 [Caldiserica bacterium]|nr:hypothetical protein [Caldisericota bacterium]